MKKSAGTEGQHGDAGQPAASGGDGKIGAVAVFILAFGAVVGGPPGIEAAVGAGGALPTLITLIAAGFLWSATQSLVIAELATMFPDDAGFLSWGVHGLGPIGGFVNAANGLISTVLVVVLYPVLIASYCQQLWPGMSAGALFGIKAAATTLGCGVNIFGVHAVERITGAMTIFVQLPFYALPIIGVAQGMPFEWSVLGSAQTGWQGQFAVFLSTICWSAQGWPMLGNVAGQVRNPARAYPRGALSAAAAAALNYIIPLSLIIPISPDTTEWDTGYFVTLASNIGGAAFSYVMLAACIASCMCNFIPLVTSGSRALQAAVHARMVPVPWLARSDVTRYGTPVPAILLQWAFVMAACSLNFNTIVVWEVLLACFALLLQFTAFLILRWRKPDAQRPFSVPGGWAGAWVVMIAFSGLCGFVVYANAAEDLISMGAAIGLQAALLPLAFAWRRWGYDPAHFAAQEAGAAEGVHAHGAAAVKAATAAGAAVGGDAARPAGDKGKGAAAFVAGPSAGAPGAHEHEEDEEAALAGPGSAAKFAGQARRSSAIERRGLLPTAAPERGHSAVFAALRSEGPSSSRASGSRSSVPGPHGVEREGSGLLEMHPIG